MKHWYKRGFFLWISLIIPSLAFGAKPNIVVILADDLGYGSVNAYGADKALVRTPHIDRLAKGGMRFTNAYTPASICSPTRYGLLTGRYPWRSSLKFGVVNPMDPLLPEPDRITLADWLHDQGYRTAAIGKWHLGYGSVKPVDFTKPLRPGPLELGFDYHFGVPQNHGDMLGVYIENDHIYGLRSARAQPYSRSYYGAPYMGFDAPQRVNQNVMGDLTDQAVQWVKSQQSSVPFFLFFAAVAVHHPITPSDTMRGMSDCGPYGDFIQDLDWSVGKIVETLEYKGLMENTVLFFLSDNGGEIPGNNPQAPETQAIAAGLTINGHLRGDKHTIWEGGCRIPFIVAWPNKIAKDAVCHEMINVIDLFATVQDITPGDGPRASDIAPDSHSFYPSLIGSDAISPRRSMVTADVNGIHAIRMGDWKLIDNTAPPGLPEKRSRQIRDTKPQLYNLQEDPGETRDRYEENRTLAKEMLAELNRIRDAE